MSNPVDYVPAPRVRALNDASVDGNGSIVVYWMTASRRLHHNFGLQRAIGWGMSLGKPVVVLEALRHGYAWASARFHTYVLQGMADNLEQATNAPITYYPFVETREHSGSGLLEALGAMACVVVTDDYPAFFLPRMVEAAAKRLHVLLESVDSNGLYPMRSTDRVFARAHDFRRHLHKQLPPHLGERPLAEPLAGLELPPAELPAQLQERWPAQRSLGDDEIERLVAALPIDQDVAAAPERGGSRAGAKRLQTFAQSGLGPYGEGRNDPDQDTASRLSAYLHFGHVGAHQVFDAIVEAEDWNPGRLAEKPTGKREGWWGMSDGAESYLDELITWREVGFNYCAHRSDFDRYDSLPEWARETLEEHASDDRPHLYSLAQLERAETHDEIWNAAQRQLLVEGRIHNYLRMLWGKKVLEWSPTPQVAAQRLIELNNKYALDGRDPNSYSGIFWIFGRYDRAWGPERPIFGKIRYMSSDSTRRKLKIKGYLERFSPEGPEQLSLASR